MNLEVMFQPKSIAIIGASRKEGSVGYDVLKNLIMGCVFECEFCRPFTGKIYPVNPNAEKILGKKCYLCMYPLIFCNKLIFTRLLD